MKQHVLRVNTVGECFEGRISDFKSKSVFQGTGDKDLDHFFSVAQIHVRVVHWLGQF